MPSNETAHQVRMGHIYISSARGEEDMEGDATGKAAHGPGCFAKPIRSVELHIQPNRRYEAENYCADVVMVG